MQSAATLGTTKVAQGGVLRERWLALLCTLFFFSGFPALIYQLIWQRALFRIFGVNIESVTIVVTAFMLGLGIGSIAGGWLSARRSIPLLPLLAAIEALTGLFGYFSLGIFEQVGILATGWPLPALAATSLALVIVPTLLMGATLPVLVGYLVQRLGNVGSSVGLLYYVNTLGAGVACVVGALVLFPWLGMQASVEFAVAINAAVALTALFAHVTGGRLAAPNAAKSTRTETVGTGPSKRWPLMLLISAFGGMVCLSYEIFFFRIVSYATGSSPIAFAATLGAFLIGLASAARECAQACKFESGHAVAARAVRAWVIANAAGALMLPLLRHSEWLRVGTPGVALGLVFLVACNLGALLPSLAHLAVPADARAGERTAQLFLANIVGAACGSVLTGFVLVEHLNIVEIAQALVGAGLACTLCFAWASGQLQRFSRPRVAAIAMVAIAVLLAMPISSNNVLEALLWKGKHDAAEPFRHVVENRSGIITVDQEGAIYGNGMYDGRYSVDLANDTNGIFRPFALSLFHPAPRRVLMIGLSSGSWAQVIANHPQLESLVIVEINPGYSKLIALEPSTASVLHHPKVRFIVDDGRRWLQQYPQEHFDAIVANMSYHYRANATNVLSTEFLQLAKAHLNPGGIAFYNTTDSDRAQRTACEVFAHGARFGNHVVVSSSPIDWDFSRWRETLLHYSIDDRPVLNPEREADRTTLERLMLLESHLIHSSSAGDDNIETCPEVLRRTAGRTSITDDNMGTEWRWLWGDR